MVPDGLILAGLYERISQDDGTGLGVARQRADNEALAARKGWRVVRTYTDNNVSAWSTRKRRPGYEQLCRDLKDGVVNAVVAWHPDRLHRSPRDLEDFVDLVEATGALVATCTAGDYDLSTPDGRCMARIVGAVARKESDDKSRRLRRKAEELAQNGKVAGGGVRPFGFERDRVTVRPDEAARVREAAQRVLAGDSLYAIVGDWTAEGVGTSTGVAWSTTSLKSTLVRPRIAGLREHRGVVVGPAEWSAILDRPTWERVRAILTDPSRRKNPVVRSYLLTGMIRCAGCGGKLVAAPRGRHLRGYGCTAVHSEGVRKVFALAEPVEAIVTEAVLVALESPELLAQLEAPEEDDGLVGTVVADEAKLLELASMWDEGQIGRAEWMSLRAKVEGRLASAHELLARRRRANVLDGLTDASSGGVRAAWARLSLERRRAVIATVVDRITLNPATGPRSRFDPTRIDITWRC